MQKNNVQNIEISQGAVGARLKGLLQSPLPVDYKITIVTMITTTININNDTITTTITNQLQPK